MPIRSMHFQVIHVNGQAKGRFDASKKSLTLLKGSRLTIELRKIPASNIAQNYREVKRHVKNGNIRRLANGTHEVVRDIHDLSPSAARVFVDGRAGSGWQAWRLANGSTIDSLRRPAHQSSRLVATVTNVATPLRETADASAKSIETSTKAGKVPRNEFSLLTCPRLPDYLRERADRIRKLDPQVLPRWDGSYDKLEHEQMTNLRAKFPTGVISRDEILELYSRWENPVFCLVTTMVWGGIDAKRDSEKKNRVSHLRSLLKEEERSLAGKMNEIRTLVRRGEIDKAFQACAEGRCKIPGVGPSFFTKILFFLGQVNPTLNPAPLIWDKWTAHAFCVLGVQSAPSDAWRGFFDVKPLYRKNGDAVVPQSKHRQLYQAYITWMNQWANELDVSPAKLEQFVFGISRKTKAGKAKDNPRNELVALGQKLFPAPISTG